MLSTLAFLVIAWALTVPAVLALAKLLGRVSAPRTAASQAAAEPEGATALGDNVVPLVPRPQNALVRVRVEALREAS